MNVFELKDKLISDYSSFVKGFITIKDESIKRIVSDELNGGLLWPDPLLQISPYVVFGEQIEQLILQGTLHPDCAKIFRIKNAKTDLGKAMQLYRHQAEAIKQADKNFNVVIKHSKRKTASIYIERDSSITVIVPDGTTDLEVQNLLKQNEYKIYKYQEKRALL